MINLNFHLILCSSVLVFILTQMQADQVINIIIHVTSSDNMANDIMLMLPGSCTC